MAVLFFANCKPQIFCFTFNIQGVGKGATWQLNLYPYTQQRIYKDTSVELLKKLLDQVHHYGFHTYQQALDNPKFEGYAYSFGKPFTESEIIELKTQCFRSSQAMGKERRNKSLLETGNNLLQKAVKLKIAGVDEMAADPNNFGIKIIQNGNQYERGQLHEDYRLR